MLSQFLIKTTMNKNIKLTATAEAEKLQVFFPFEGRAQEDCYLIAVRGASSREEALKAIKEDGHEVVVEDGGRFLQNNKDGKHFRVECYS